MSARFHNYVLTNSSYTGEHLLVSLPTNHGSIINLNDGVQGQHQREGAIAVQGQHLPPANHEQLRGGIQHPALPAPTTEVMSAKFKRKLKDFEDTYNYYMPSIACSHCSILQLPRMANWQPFDDDIAYGITAVLHLLPTIRTVGELTQVALCNKCVAHPQMPPKGGPWPDLLLSLPHRSRMFLSPLTLQTSLGRTHAARAARNPYSTYRTLTGRMKVTHNPRAVALFSGSIGAYLESSSYRGDAGHNIPLLENCRLWLLQQNPLYTRYDLRARLQLYPLPVADLADIDGGEQRPPGRPEVVMNPFNYPSETRNEDYRSHRLPVATLQGSNGEDISLLRGDPAVEALLFPVLYPHGHGQWLRPPPHEKVRGKGTRMQDAVLKLNSVISHYRDDHYWPAWIYMEIEAIRLFQNNQRLINGQTKRSLDGRLPPAELLQRSAYGNWSIVNEKLTTTIPRFIRTGEAYFINAESRIKAMLKAYGIPTLFVTITFSEKWAPYVQHLARTGNQDTLPSNRPWDAVQYYFERWYWLKKEFLRKPHLSTFGRLNELVERHEFQQRGAIHSHCLLWTQKSKHDLLPDDFIRADLPDAAKEPQLHALVLQHQIHDCSPEYCGGPFQDGSQCKKGFPAPLSNTTHALDGELRYKYKRLTEADRRVVPYNARLLLIWKAHLNVQFCTSGGLANYVSKYVTKAEPKSVVNVRSKDHITSHLEARRIGAMEMMVLLLGFRIFDMTSGCIYLPTAKPEERSLAVKPSWMLEEDPDNPYFDDALEKYFNRPLDANIEACKYFEYHARYTIARTRKGNAERFLYDRNGYIVTPRRKEQLIRHSNKRLAHGESFFFLKLLQNKPWRSDNEIIGNAATYREQFMTLFPEEYREAQEAQRVALHHHQLCMSNLYLDIVEALLDGAPATLTDIVKDQLAQMQKMNIQPPVQDETLHLQGDQYTAYNFVSSCIASSRHTGLFFFITGPAGTGKSYLLKGLERFFASNRMRILLIAPTGIAANNIGGQTLHSALAIGQTQSDGRYKSSVFQWSDEKQADLRKVKILIIDEISMVNSELFMFVSSIFSRLHQDNHPFGNIHVICFGDLMQLPPVTGQKVFRAPIWKLFHPVFLRQPQRQAGDLTFFTFLNKIRFGNIDGEVEDQLQACQALYQPGAQTYLNTSLVSLRKTALSINSVILSTLPDGDSFIHYAIDREDGQLLAPHSSPKTFSTGTNFPDQVNCGRGAKVMFLTNTLLAKGISNGSCGIVTGLRDDGMPNVAFPVPDGVLIVEVDIDTVHFVSNGIPYTRQQVPLQNAYALTVHKTQGLSLSSITISLDDTFFSPGQAYTALSRAREWKDVSIAAYTKNAFKVDKDAIQEYTRLEQRARELR